jgi:pantoate--beta-alanine ligase
VHTPVKGAAPPRVIADPVAWRDVLDCHRAGGATVGLVPTMGALHDGHLSLIRLAAAQCEVVAVTIYVNPLQFAAGEDLASYPRDLDGDLSSAGEVGAALVFAPTPEDLWPTPPGTMVSVPALSTPLEGLARPGHFDGVGTIVTKLFSLAGPCRAYFGEKDFQQVAVVRQLVKDLSLPVEVIAGPTVRNTDGLALSSRNAYLTAGELRAAPALYYALLAGRRAVEAGETRGDTVRAVMAQVLAAEPGFATPDYLDVVDPQRLVSLDRVSGEVRLLGAARLGRARLIDNIGATSPFPNPAAPNPIAPHSGGN